MTYQLLESSANTVFWEIPPGKPNPAEPFTGIGMLDTRSRVDAPGQKHDTCTYYAFNFFRPRVGKHPGSDPALRRIEQLFSQHRKQHTSLLTQKDRDIRIITSLYLQAAGQSIAEYADVSMEAKQQLLQKLGTVPNGAYSDMILRHCFQAMKQLNEDVLSALSFDLHEFTQQLLREAGNQPRPYAMLQLEHQLAISSAAMTFARLKYYPQLTISSWTIKDGPQALMDELRQYGPINARGYYGNDYYAKGALMALKNPLCDHQIYGWKPNTRIETMPGTATHSIVVMGMIKNEADKFFMLFIDPADASALNTQRKIYQLSYDNFSKYMGNLYGFQTSDSGIPGKDCMLRCTC